jgi:WD40 repeat protein
MRRAIFHSAALLSAILASAPLSAQTPESKPKLDLYGDPLPPGAVQRLGTVAFRHRTSMPSIAFSPDGKTIASPDDDHINLWDTATQKVVRVYRLGPPIEGRNWWYRDVAFSPDGTLLLASAGTQSGAEKFDLSRVFVWDAPTGRFLRAINRAHVSRFCFCGDDHTIAIAEKSEITYWDVTRGRRTIDEAPADPKKTYLREIAFVPKANTVVASCDDGILRFRKLDEPSEQVVSSRRDIETLAASPTGRLFAVGGSFGLSVWDAETRRSVAEWRRHKNRSPETDVLSVAFSPDGSLLASGHDDGEVVVWGVPAWKRRLGFHVARGAGSIRFSPDGKVLACASIERVLSFWDPATGKRLLSFADPNTGKPLRSRAGHDGPVASLAFSPAGDRLASRGPEGSIRVWDPASGAEIRRHDGSFTAGPVWSADGSMLAAAGFWTPDGSSSGVQLWDAATGEARQRTTDKDPIRAFALSPDRKLVELRATNALSRTDLKSDKLLGRSAPLKSCSRFALFHDGVRAIVSGQDDAGTTVLEIWDLAANRRVQKILYDFDDPAITLAPNDQLLACAQKKWLWVVDVTEQLPIFSLGKGTAPIRSVAFAPHCKIVAIGRDDGSIELCDVGTAQVIAEMNGEQGSVESLAFSPDGRSLAAGGTDSTVLLWSMRDLLAGGGDNVDIPNLWQDLGRDDDVRRVYRAIELLADRPAESMPFLRRRVKPLAPVPKERLSQLFAELGSGDFRKREEATRALLLLGGVIEADLRKLRHDATSPEIARRADGILERLLPRTSEERRLLRAVLALEAIGNPDAIQLLDELGRGASGAALTLDARAARARITARQRTASR